MLGASVPRKDIAGAQTFVGEIPSARSTASTKAGTKASTKAGTKARHRRDKQCIVKPNSGVSTTVAEYFTNAASSRRAP